LTDGKIELTEEAKRGELSGFVVIGAAALPTLGPIPPRQSNAVNKCTSSTAILMRALKLEPLLKT
jgi:hypothetical protein